MDRSLCSLYDRLLLAKHCFITVRFRSLYDRLLLAKHCFMTVRFRSLYDRLLLAKHCFMTVRFAHFLKSPKEQVPKNQGNPSILQILIQTIVPSALRFIGFRDLLDFQFDHCKRIV